MNILTPFKKFLGNKNTVTILGVLMGIVVLYIGYDWRVKQSTNPVSIPYAKQEITSRTLIDENMIGYTDVPASLVNASSNLVRQSQDIIGKYVSYATTIPKNSLFYSEVLMTSEEMPDSSFANIPKDYTIFALSVTNETTYGNSIFPGNTIDLYAKTTHEDGRLIYGNLIKSIQVLDVKDSSGNHVFETTQSAQPAVLLFAVPENLFLLLKKATYLGDVTIEPVPRNRDYSVNPGETRIDSNEFKKIILTRAYPLDTQEE